jgi:hypothetical protein
VSRCCQTIAQLPAAQMRYISKDPVETAETCKDLRSHKTAARGCCPTFNPPR